MPCSSQVISEVMPEIHTMEKFGFLKSMIYSKIISIPVLKSLFNGAGTARRVILYLYMDRTFYGSFPGLYPFYGVSSRKCSLIFD